MNEKNNEKLSIALAWVYEARKELGHAEYEGEKAEQLKSILSALNLAARDIEILIRRTE